MRNTKKINGGTYMWCYCSTPAESCLVDDQVDRVSRPDGMASGGAGTSDALDGRPEEGEGNATTQPAEG